MTTNRGIGRAPTQELDPDELQITDWLPIDGKTFPSQYGTVDNPEWLWREEGRIPNAHIRANPLQHKQQTALFYMEDGEVEAVEYWMMRVK